MVSLIIISYLVIGLILALIGMRNSFFQNDGMLKTFILVILLWLPVGVLLYHMGELTEDKQGDE
jgi:sulfite exporter TauE/SafE